MNDILKRTVENASNQSAKALDDILEKIIGDELFELCQNGIKPKNLDANFIYTEYGGDFKCKEFGTMLPSGTAIIKIDNEIVGIIYPMEIKSDNLKINVSYKYWSKKENLKSIKK